ncbi:ECF transporter S component [Agromyces sp. G08B096]|uniref:ECF transporter S component n=1 Tax=Agromyces sp. G08B096 TaxID=3156399 RepID=A0AAU7W817_9MICO
MKLPTRILLTCAAIGTAGGLLLVPLNWISASIAAAMPLLYAVLSGVWTVPFVVAFALIRRPGTALLTGLIAGIVNAGLTPQGPSAILTSLMVGAMIEIPIALGGYRSWRAWIWYVGAAVFGLAYSLYSMAYLDFGANPVWMQAAYAVIGTASNVAAIWVGRSIAARLEAAGVARGLQPRQAAPAVAARQEPAAG